MTTGYRQMRDERINRADLNTRRSQGISHISGGHVIFLDGWRYSRAAKVSMIRRRVRSGTAPWSTSCRITPVVATRCAAGERLAQGLHLG